MSVIEVPSAHPHLFDPGSRVPPDPVHADFGVSIRRDERVDLAAMLDTAEYRHWVEANADDLRAGDYPEWTWPGEFIEEKLTAQYVGAEMPSAAVEVEVEFRWTEELAAQVERALRVRW
jgi:hypothetical protein